MLTVSETATEELRKTLDEVPPNVAYRLLVSDEGYKLRLDRPSTPFSEFGRVDRRSPSKPQRWE